MEEQKKERTTTCYQYWLSTKGEHENIAITMWIEDVIEHNSG